MAQAKAAEPETGCPDGCAWISRHFANCPVWLATCMSCNRVNVEDLTEQAEKLRAEVHPESFCDRCKRRNVSWSAPSPLWNQVMRGGDINGDDIFNGIVCPTCFAELAQEQGIADVWQFSARRVHVPLQTVTPSGRVWNEQTWKFDEPQ